MATSEVPLGLFIAIPVYFALMVGLAIYAFFSTRRRHAAEAKMGVEEDAMSSHFLSGRSLGPFVSACTLFASIFSGYTVVGVPNEAFYKGWVALRWIPGMQFFALGYVCTSSRLAKASLARNHQSPVDFITDRYRSQILRYTTLFFQVFPSIIYLTAQISSIHSTFNVLFGISLNNYTPVVLICLLIVALEWIGGLQSVAMTDAAQGLLMVLCFITASFVILSKYGPWSDLDWETYPQPSFYQTPDGETQWNMWEFMFLLFSGFTMPHMIQRVYAASSMKALKCAYVVGTCGPWLTMLAGVYFGTMAVVFLQGQEVSSPFASIIDNLIAFGGFAEVVGVIMYTTSLAAIMSTADSILIAINHLLTAELAYPIRPNASSKAIAIYGKIASLVTMALGFLFFLAIPGLQSLLAVQFSSAAQAMPVFFIGLYMSDKQKPHPWSIAAGMWLGWVVVFLINESYNKARSENPNHFTLNPGIIGLACNVAFIAILETVRNLAARFSKKDSSSADDFITTRAWDTPALKRFGEKPLDDNLLTSLMRGVHEPLLQTWFFVFVLAISAAILPLSGAGLPPLDAAGNLAYAPGIIGGIPDWAFWFIMWALVFTAVVLYECFRIPNDFPADENTDNPDTLIMTKQELLMRQSYDGVNESLLRRRSTLALSLNPATVKSLEKLEEEIDEESSDSKSLEKGEIDEEPAKNEEQSSNKNCRIT